MQAATADLQMMKAEVAQKTMAMQAELPVMFEVMVEQVKDFLASENMASLKEMRQLYQVSFRVTLRARWVIAGGR
jgi:hypothetical protein